MFLEAFLLFICVLTLQVLLTVHSAHIRYFNLMVYKVCRYAGNTLSAAWGRVADEDEVIFMGAVHVVVPPVVPVVLPILPPVIGCPHLMTTARGSTVGYIQKRCKTCGILLFRDLRPMANLMIEDGPGSDDD